ncbi:glycosyltransferase [Alteromonadaceae bacterium M269]|nr:glycosyltransferase [Alteromonadaceae bacterium M269]
MHIAMLSPIAWRTPPRKYGPWENIVSLLTEGLIKQGVEVTLFATGDSITKGHLRSVCQNGYEEDKSVNPKVLESLHIASLFESGDEFDLIHNHFDFLPLTYSQMTTTPLLTTIHGFSSSTIFPVYEKYNKRSNYISISDANRAPSLDYLATVHHGIDLEQFTYCENGQGYLLFFGRIHNDKGTREAIEIALAAQIKLLIVGLVQDQDYFNQFVEPKLQLGNIEFIDAVGPLERNTLLGGALALLHPIQFDEPFGLSVIEAMACGTPVIAFNRGSMPELIKHGETGFLVNDVDTAVVAVRKIKQIDRMACREHIVEHFSVDRMVENYLKVYQQLATPKEAQSLRPWGFYTILADRPYFKAKEIVVFQGKRLSLQRHTQRDEHWLVINGTAEVTLGTKHLLLQPGQSIDIPRNMLHRVANPSASVRLKFVEIQTGEYFGEDDIERLEDDYGRVNECLKLV